MMIRSWHDAPPDVVAPLYASEARHWHEAFHWDTGRQWSEVEQARVSWGLPGLLAHRADGSTDGWCFYLREDGVVQIGGLVSDAPLTTAALIDGVLAAPAASGAEALSCFVPDRAPGLSAALAARGFALDPFLYMTRDLASWRGPAADDSGLTSWGPEALEPTAMTLRGAYPSRVGRYFASHDRPDEWSRYVRNMVEQPGCGVFRPDLTRVAWDGPRVAGVILMTCVDRGTAHVAQLAVHPAQRQCGIARRLVTCALARAAADGCGEVTLLVAAGNAAARALYASLGFVASGAFIAAYRLDAAGPVSPCD